jgi:hypothetical protein
MWSEFTEPTSQIEKGLTRLPPQRYEEFARAVGKSVEEVAKQLLEYYDPYTYEALFGKRKEHK